MPGNDPACTHSSTVAAGPVLGLQNWSYSGANVYVWRPSVAPDGTIYGLHSAAEQRGWTAGFGQYSPTARSNGRCR